MARTWTVDAWLYGERLGGFGVCNSSRRVLDVVAELLRRPGIKEIVITREK